MVILIPVYPLAEAPIGRGAGFADGKGSASNLESANLCLSCAGWAIACFQCRHPQVDAPVRQLFHRVAAQKTNAVCRIGLRPACIDHF